MTDRRRTTSGFTLIELMILMVIIGVLATLGIMSYGSMIDRARVVKAVGDIKAISVAVDDYKAKNREYPATLTIVGEADRLDPWGVPYSYVTIADAGARARKDRNLVPVNTDFDLYSLGKDGKSRPPFTAAVSKDDVVRCNDGAFVGLASEY